MSTENNRIQQAAYEKDCEDFPDKNYEFIDNKTGLNCKIRRGPFGPWCGYVQVPKNHPHYYSGYDEPEVNVHGDLTFGSSDGWFGFDTSHFTDYTPPLKNQISLILDLGLHRETYKTYDFVYKEVSILA